MRLGLGFALLLSACIGSNVVAVEQREVGSALDGLTFVLDGPDGVTTVPGVSAEAVHAAFDAMAAADESGDDGHTVDVKLGR